MQNILVQKINEIDCSVNIDITKEESKKPCDIQPVPQLKPQPNMNKYSALIKSFTKDILSLLLALAISILLNFVLIY